MGVARQQHRPLRSINMALTSTIPIGYAMLPAKYQEEKATIGSTMTNHRAISFNCRPSATRRQRTDSFDTARSSPLDSRSGKGNSLTFGSPWPYQRRHRMVPGNLDFALGRKLRMILGEWSDERNVQVALRDQTGEKKALLRSVMDDLRRVSLKDSREFSGVRVPLELRIPAGLKPSGT